ncbi:bifunctional folylpolyglutamate synthase/dihydrofolate synthase [Candidatus Micrarchaeota archaeon]|nr:bifunctional folylpolyglutamate synthase/dihydrofolate synthase [Candidatus Micrarchaeota archaeon]MBU1930245.1 bifunctional folylpolyglutamate synthase/dihydrofolate synthase [Candidatus Micrarchaeota archaeon]
MQYPQAVQFLDSLENKGIKLGLERMQAIMRALGNPHQQVNSILVGGTNGKGSTTAFLNQLLLKNQYNVGLYTSPHLTRYNERILVNNKPISNQAFAKQVATLKERIEQEALEVMHFEFLTALALNWFCQQKVDIAIVEVGLGGRLDATNIVSPIASAITNIGLEHQEWLGNSLREIALEKAGIIKEQAPIICTETNSELNKIFQDIANGKKAPFYCLEKDFSVETPVVSLKKTSMNFKGLGLELGGMELGLRGRHQATNAGLALATLQVLKKQNKIRLTKASISKALKKTTWPGRFQILGNKPVVIVDVCHNPSGCKALAETLESALHNQKITLVFGSATDKNSFAMLQALAPFVNKLVLCQSTQRGTLVEELNSIAKKLFPSFKISSIADVNAAVKKTIQKASPQETILICGSIFVVREAIPFLKKKDLQKK